MKYSPAAVRSDGKLNARRSLFMGAVLVAASFLSVTANASPIVVNGLSPTTTFFDPSTGILQWTSGPILVGQTIGPANNVELSLNLTGNVTTASALDISLSYGAGIALANQVNPGDEMFGFTYQLTENGVDVGAPFGFDLLNPFPFAVDTVGTGQAGGPVSTTFNGINVTIYNNSQVETVQSFQAYVGVPSPIPDTFSTLSLLAIGLLVVVGVSRRLPRTEFGR